MCKSGGGMTFMIAARRTKVTYTLQCVWTKNQDFSSKSNIMGNRPLVRSYTYASKHICVWISMCMGTSVHMVTHISICRW